jgi:hypothetical protein
VANAEQNADQAKSAAGPNPVAVSDAKGTAAPISPSDLSMPMVGLVSGNSSGNGGRSAGVNPSKPPAQNNGNKPTNDPVTACQQLPNNSTSTQDAICNFMGNDQNKIARVQGAFQLMLQENPTIKNGLPLNIGLAGVISGKGQNFETARATMLKDPAIGH